jgi:hypothetical protein
MLPSCHTRLAGGVAVRDACKRKVRCDAGGSAFPYRRLMPHSLFKHEVCALQNVSGIVSPMAFAVLRLIANSNFVGCSMGRSLGFLPCKIFCTNLALCRNAAGPSAPYESRPPISTNARAPEAAGKRYLMAISVTGLMTKLPWTIRAHLLALAPWS